MNIYIDESGSINNHLQGNGDFVVAMICVKDHAKLKRAYKRFVSSNMDRLKELDRDKIDPSSQRVIRQGGKMFHDDSFSEIKGCQLDRRMKLDFVNYISRGEYFDVLLLHFCNKELSDNLCSNTARAFNYVIRLSLGHFIKNGLINDDTITLHFDERNERTETKHFLQEYLNTELMLDDQLHTSFTVQYYDSKDQPFIQIADVFANLYYSHLLNNGYSDCINDLSARGVLKKIFTFPPNASHS